MTDNQETRVCGRCNGTGTVTRDGFCYNGREYPAKTEVCGNCDGEKMFSYPDFGVIETLITTARGAGEGKRKMRASMTSTQAFKGDRAMKRAVYVHRLAAFHGSNRPGASCMPVMADIALGRDPFRKEIDAFADAMAKKYYGTDMRAAVRWGKAFGIL